MGCKLTRAGEGPGCDEAAAAAAGSSSDCGDAATRRSASATPSTSTLPAPTPSSTSTLPAPTPSSPSPPPAPTPSSPSPPPAPTPLSPTASSPSPSTSSPSASPPQSPSLTPSSLSSADESSTSTPSSTSYSDEEDQWEEEQKFEERYLQSIEIPHPQEIAWGEEQEVDQLKGSSGSTHLYNTFSQSEEFCHISESDDDGVFPNKFKLGDKEPVLTLLEEFEDDTIIGKIMLLDEKYGSRRRIARDGSCFYRSFIFKYLENVVEIKDEDERRTEAARFRRRVENCMPACHDDQLLHSFSGFESVVNLVEQGLAEGELYQMDMNEDVTSRIIPLLRALTEIEICTRPEFYHGFLIPGDTYASVFEFCLCEVRQGDGEANNMQVYALAHALGIPVILENLDVNTPGQLNTLHFCRHVESEAEAPLALTLLYRPGHYDIIYPK